MNLQEKYIGAIQGTAIGDALGLPFEAHTRSQIIRLLNQEYLGNKDGLIDRYYPIGRHAMYRPYIASGQYPFLQADATGICSDDTLLTLAIAGSIQEKGGIDLDDIIARHIQSVQEEPFGFGNGTKQTMLRIAHGEDWKNISEPSFGNGVMMKQFPFAFHEVASGKDASDSLMELARITHAHPVALVSTRVHHKLLVDILLDQGEKFDMAYWLQEGIEFAQSCEKEYGSSILVSTLMTDIKNDGMDDRSLYSIGDSYARKIEQEKNAYFNVLSTLGIVYALFLRKQNFTVIQEGVSIGGDTDSYASILGGMVGALGSDGFDKKYQEGIHPRYQEKMSEVLKK